MLTRLLSLIAVVQGLLALRVFVRMARTFNSSRIERVTPGAMSEQAVTVVVPVLNEQDRLEPCLTGLMQQSSAVRQIRVVDGGSSDATLAIVDRARAIDQRIVADDASPVPNGVNGKAWGLDVATSRIDPDTGWILVVDADVRPDAGLVDAMVAKAAAENVDVLSVATRQKLSGWAEGILHPSMLTTLVYRYGIPGHIAHSVQRVQANGQCLLVRRAALEQVGGFASILHANAEDVTLVRSMVASGHPAGFYEAGDLVSVEMYASWKEAWHGWSRSLPMRDRYSSWDLGIGLLEVGLVQAAPLILWPLSIVLLGASHPLSIMQSALTAGRIGVLMGTRRAYVDAPSSYWLSPLADLPVAVRLLEMARRQRFTWRGRELLTGE